MQTWLITGCSSGLGRGFAKAVLKSGDQVIVTARRVETLKDLVDAYPEQALALSLDVTKEEDIKNAVEKGLERFGTIDVLINNAGYGYRAAVEEGVPKEVDQLFQTNLFGPIALIKAVLPIMRKNHRGTIANVSSIAALGAALGSGYYAATKSALESISEALYGETKDLGIHVMIIEPGAFRTNFAGTSLKESSVELGDYEKTAGTRRVETLKDLVDAYPEQALALSLDVTKEEDIKNAVEKGLERFGTIDVLINNAGYGYRAAVEEGVPKEVDQLFQTNLFGPIALIKAVLPIMRKNHRGTIANVSSIAALGAALGSGYYAATKSALESISEALYGETKDLGIHVMIIEPGAFRTNFAGTSLKESSVELGDYEKTAGTRRIRNDHTDGTQQGDPDEAGRVLVDLVHSGKMPLRLLLGSDAQAYGKSRLTARLDEYKAWEVTSNRTDFKE